MGKELATFLNESKSKRPKFSPEPFYNSYGDCIEWFFSNEECSAERVDNRLTIYRSLENGDLVGCQIKGIRELVDRYGASAVKLTGSGNSERIDLALLFLVSNLEALPVLEDPGVRRDIYRDLVSRAGRPTVDLTPA